MHTFVQLMKLYKPSTFNGESRCRIRPVVSLNTSWLLSCITREPVRCLRRDPNGDLAASRDVDGPLRGRPIGQGRVRTPFRWECRRVMVWVFRASRVCQRRRDSRGPSGSLGSRADYRPPDPSTAWGVKTESQKLFLVICNACGGDIEHIVNPEGEQLYRALRCQNNDCAKTWNRDDLGSKNIGMQGLHLLQHHSYGTLCREREALVPSLAGCCSPITMLRAHIAN